MRVRTRALIVTALAAATIPLFAAPSAARVTSGPCVDEQNTATIDGRTYTPKNDTSANPVVVEGGETITVAYTGTTTAPITDHRGEIRVEIGPGGWVVGDWGSANKPKPTLSKTGTKTITVPNVVGIFDITGFHQGTGGRCEGYAVLKIDGNPLTTPVGAGAAGGTLLAGAGVAYAMVAKPRRGVA